MRLLEDGFENMTQDDDVIANQRAKLAAQCWAELAVSSFDNLSLEAIAEQLGISASQAHLAAGSVTDLILYQLDKIDHQALSTSFADFEDDPDATIYEKLFEGLVMRFETFADHRAQISALHDAAKRNPALGLHLSHQLADVIGKLLWLAGDESTGFIKQARKLGVTAAVMRVRPVWQEDHSADLGQTMKKLDDELKKACEWAISLRILSKDDVTLRQGDM